MAPVAKIIDRSITVYLFNSFLWFILLLCRCRSGRPSVQRNFGREPTVRRFQTSIRSNQVARDARKPSVLVPTTTSNWIPHRVANLSTRRHWPTHQQQILVSLFCLREKQAQQQRQSNFFLILLFHFLILIDQRPKTCSSFPLLPLLLIYYFNLLEAKYFTLHRFSSSPGYIRIDLYVHRSLVHIYRA